MIERLVRPTLVLVVVAVVVRVEPVLGLGLVLGGWLLWSGYGPKQALAGVSVRRTHPQRVMWGDEFEVGVEVSSDRRLRFVEVMDLAPFDLGDSGRWAMSLTRDERVSRIRSINARRRGLHQLGPTLVTTGDLFSLASHSRRIGDVNTVLVYPQIVPVGNIPVTPESPEPVVVTSRPLFLDPHRIRGVRPYQAGDSMRAIHWTSSASAGELLVKDLEPASHQDVVVSVDMAQLSHPLSGRHRSGELAVVVAASLLHHYVTTERRPTGLRLAGLDTVVSGPVDIDSSPEIDDLHLMESLEMLARVRLDRARTSHALLDPLGLAFGTTLIHVAGQVSTSQFLGLADLRRRGVAVKVIVTGGTPTAEIANGLAGEGIGLSVIDRSADLGVSE